MYNKLGIIVYICKGSMGWLPDPAVLMTGKLNIVHLFQAFLFYIRLHQSQKKILHSKSNTKTQYNINTHSCWY